jgi:hypothetical protein
MGATALVTDHSLRKAAARLLSALTRLSCYRPDCFCSRSPLRENRDPNADLLEWDMTAAYGDSLIIRTVETTGRISRETERSVM